MRNISYSPLLGLTTLALLAGGTARAQPPESPYGYVGAGAGQSRAGIDASRLAGAVPALRDNGFSITSTSRDERDTSFKVFGGLQINRYFGVEASYFRLGRFGYEAMTSPAGQVDGRLKVQGLGLDLTGSLPLGDRLSAMARVGYQRARTSADWTGSGGLSSLSRSARDHLDAPRYGLGLQYAVSPDLLLRAEAERSRFADMAGGKAHVTTYVVSVVLPFGGRMEAAPRTAYASPPPQRASAEPAPAPVVVMAAAPTPAPVMLAAAPLAAPLRRVSFSAASMFGFDSAELQPPGMKALDSFAHELAGTRVDTIAVTGHTDRLGSDTYNQALSDKRASAVKSYLVGSAGLDGTRISAQGRSEREPVTQSGDCKGPSSPRVIACLQPDRRVDILVSGMR